MKKVLFSLAFTALLLSSCGSDENVPDIPSGTGEFVASISFDGITTKSSVSKAIPITNWDNVKVLNSGILTTDETYVGKLIQVEAEVDLANLTPQDVGVQVFYGSIDPHNNLVNTQSRNLKLVSSNNGKHLYSGEYECPDTGKQGFTIRILPQNELMIYPSDLYLCAWA